MRGFLIKRTDQGGGYVARPGQFSSYTKDIKAARIFKTKEEAEKERCVGNEVIIPFEGEFHV